MHIRRLVNPVILQGESFLGIPARLEFQPAELPGWKWYSYNWDVPVKVSPSVTETRMRRICLRNGKKVFPVFEHFGALQWLGLTNLIIAQHSRLVPYYGSAWQIWEAVVPHTKQISREVSWATVPEEFCFCYLKARAGREAFTRVSPRQEPGLRITVMVDFKNIGSMSKTVDLPYNMEELRNVLGAESPALPAWHKYIAMMIRWPHTAKLRWPRKDESPQTYLEHIVYHRMQDILGAMSLLNNGEQFLSAEITSVCSGHYADIEVVKQISQHQLVPIQEQLVA